MVFSCILFVIVLDSCCISIGDLTRDCLVFLKCRRVFEFWVLRFRDLGASRAVIESATLSTNLASKDGSFRRLGEV